MSKLLDYTGLGRFLDKLKTLFVTDVGVNGNSLTCTKDGVTSNITIPYATKTLSIPFGVTDDSSTSLAYIATVDGITELRDGVCCIIRNTKVDGGASGITIDINGLGAKSLYKSNALSSMEHYTFPKNKTYLLVFSESLDGWIVGRLTDENDNTDAYNILPYTAYLKTKTRLGRYMICLTYDEEYVLPVHDADNNTTTNKTLTTESFDPFGEVFYGLVGYATLADNPARSLYIACSSCNLMYSFNITDSAFTTYKSVYLVMSPLSDGKCKLHSNPLSQTLPTTEDGLVYKLLGTAISGYQIRLYLHKPCYYFKYGQIREWTNNNDKQDLLVSGTNIKTINGSSLLGSGNMQLNTAFEVRGTSFTPKAKDNVYRYSMVFQYSENLMVGSATSYSNTDSKELTTSDFDPFGGIYYNTDIVNDGENINGSNLFMQGYYDFRYAFKIIADPLVAGKAIYLKCEPLLDVNNNRTGRVRFASGQPIVQTLPITADGYVYIFLGWAVSTTYMFLCANHPVYEFKDGALCLWTNASTVDISGKEDSTNKITSLSSSSTDTQYPSAKCVYDLSNLKLNKIPIVSVASNASSLSCEEDKYYRLDTAVNTFSITLPTVTDVGIAKSVIIYLTTGATPAITITSTQQLHYSYGFSLEASKTYEINALWNGAAWTITSIEL